MPATVVSIINLKGGVGKSTLTMTLGEFLAFRYSKNVLLIDMDAQANLSYCMISQNQIELQARSHRTTYGIFKNALLGQHTDITNFIADPRLIVSNIKRSGMMNHNTEIHMVVSTPSVAQLDEELLSIWENGQSIPDGIRETLLSLLEPAKDRYDYVLIDCPPGLSLFSSAALLASDFYVSPVIPEPLSLEGVRLVQNRANNIRDKYGANVEFAGTILNIVKHYRNTHWRIAEQIYGTSNSHYIPFQSWLPDSEHLRKLGEFDPDISDRQWASGVEHKFDSLRHKYAIGHGLNNPESGALSRIGTEGKTYRLLDRISSLVEEFQERCS